MISAPLRVSAPKVAVGTFRSSSSSAEPPNRIRCAAAAAATAAPESASAATATATARSATALSLYGVLGLRAGATAREIRAAYRRLARERHPDVAGAPAAADFLALHHAYATLSDPDTRARYDRAATAPMAMAAARQHLHRWGPGARPRRTWETDQCW